jgi:hypothetical protein
MWRINALPLKATMVQATAPDVTLISITPISEVRRETFAWVGRRIAHSTAMK